MDENVFSWVTRAKFSHTVSHRLTCPPSPENPIPTNSDHDSSAQKSVATTVPSVAVPLDGIGRSSIPRDWQQKERKRLQRTQSTVTAVNLAELGLLERIGSELSLNPREQSLKKHSLRDKAPTGASLSSGSQSDLNSEPLDAKDRCLNPRRTDKIPPPPPVKLLPRCTQESSSSLEERRMKFCQRDTAPPFAKEIASAPRPDFVLKRSTHLTESKGRSLKPAKRVQSPLPSVPPNSQRSTLTTNHGMKTLDPKRRDSSPLLKNSSRIFTNIWDPDRKNIKSKHRALSPIPSMIHSDEFREARAETKRFSTPISRSRRKENDKGILKKLFSKESSNPSAFTSTMLPKMGMSRNQSQLKTSEKTKARKDVSWAKYFDPAVCRVSALDAMEECRINLSELYLGQRFAIGAHSRLYHGVYKTQDVAVKIINLPDERQYDAAVARKLEKEFAGEVTLLSRLHHQNVIKLVGALREDAVLCIVTEYLSGGSLRAFLHKLKDKTLALPQIIAIALGIAKGMEYIHSQGVIHRDLKPENILFDHDLCVKIADLGIACEEANCDVLVEDYGTYRFMAPEMIKHEHYGQKVDVYSFALVLWEMLTRRIPYEDMIPYQAAFAVFDKNLRPQIPSGCPPALHALIERCWAVLPDDRPEFQQIVKILEQFEVALEHDSTLNLIPKHAHPRSPPC